MSDIPGGFKADNVDDIDTARKHGEVMRMYRLMCEEFKALRAEMEYVQRENARLSSLLDNKFDRPESGRVVVVSDAD